MKLYLVQHADAMKKKQDSERPLSEQGWRDVRKMAAYLKKSVRLSVNEVAHSEKLRAKQTAQTLLSGLDARHGTTEFADLNPAAEVNEALGRIERSHTDLMLVGHMPHLNRLAGALLVGDEDADVIAFHNAGIVCLAQSESGAWQIDWVLVPELVRG